MRIGVIADVHANFEALEAVLEEFERRQVARIFCLGDLVGYGASPREVIERVREKAHGCVLGNHDAAILRDELWPLFSRNQQVVLRYTRRVLGPEHLAYLRSLPLVLKGQLATYVHASLHEPEHWPYVMTLEDAQKLFQHLQTPLCFVGHTHIPGLLCEQVGVFRFQAGPRYVINPGSVGQPRDGDPRASAAILDTEAWALEFVRVEYDVEGAARKILKAGLPREYAQRLRQGF
ncbi:MAG: metallophosphatase family protein [Bacteroidetes bacterium]|nr:metallophosphatase family protein [Rhodothermia bacterium]MCS7154354.1 metallophosphatase family protein [Bacteroidota bacterium]MCX7906609.1 metallophosphatase family protein [Bacteroidota bacterium]MDW8137110.1 metallophosphoesterase family protein [Bacteroidota bacterium]MDW8285019.1 metallophosphoesterase family protein [Bacteroidota bacterium]